MRIFLSSFHCSVGVDLLQWVLLSLLKLPRPDTLRISRPHLRHVALLQNPHTDFNEFFVPYTTTLSLNWPHDPSTVLVPNPRRHRHHVSQQPSYLEHVYHNPTLAHPNAPHFDQKHRRTKGADEKGEDDSDWEEDTYWIINPDFEEHLRDLGNWTLGGAFRDAFPHFKDYVKFHSGV